MRLASRRSGRSVVSVAEGLGGYRSATWVRARVVGKRPDAPAGEPASFLPFRRVFPSMRWIWIDKFLEFRSGQFARAIKNLTLAEEHLHDHYPGYPVMPASLIIEGLAQTGGILGGEAGGVVGEGGLAQNPPGRLFRGARAGGPVD